MTGGVSTKEFVREKLDWIKVLIADPDVKPDGAKCLGAVIAGIVNHESRIARVSDDALSDYTGGFSRTTIFRYREVLKTAGYIDHRPGRGLTASLYALRIDNVAAGLERLRSQSKMRDEQRAEKRASRLAEIKAHFASSNVSGLKHRTTSKTAVGGQG